MAAMATAALSAGENDFFIDSFYHRNSI